MRSGRLDAWGSNQHAQCTVPAGNDFLVVDGGWTFSIALQSDGFLWAWGNNEDKELDVPGGNDYKAIAAVEYTLLPCAGDFDPVRVENVIYEEQN